MSVRAQRVGVENAASANDASAPKGEIINDRSGDVATFFRILQRHYVPFMDMLRWQITGRQDFERLDAHRPGARSAVPESAAHRVRGQSRWSKLRGRSVWSTLQCHEADVGHSTSCTTALPESSSACHGQASWRATTGRHAVLSRPPYYGGDTDYGADLFDRAEYERMADVLRSLKGRFILSREN
jgi:DNA adenine methylase